jgi:hypothetical protein
VSAKNEHNNPKRWQTDISVFLFAVVLVQLSLVLLVHFLLVSQWLIVDLGRRKGSARAVGNERNLDQTVDNSQPISRAASSIIVLKLDCLLHLFSRDQPLVYLRIRLQACE